MKETACRALEATDEADKEYFEKTNEYVDLIEQYFLNDQGLESDKRGRKRVESKLYSTEGELEEKTAVKKAIIYFAVGFVFIFLLEYICLMFDSRSSCEWSDVIVFIVIFCVALPLLALSALFFSFKKTKKKHQAIQTETDKINQVIEEREKTQSSVLNRIRGLELDFHRIERSKMQQNTR